MVFSLFALGSQCVCGSTFVKDVAGTSCVASTACPARLNLAGTQCVATCTGNFADPTGAATGSQCVCATGKTANADKSDCTSPASSTSSKILQITYLLFVAVFVFFM